MSRSYEMQVTVKGYTWKHVQTIISAMLRLWNFDEGTFPDKDQPLPPDLLAVGTDNLCGGESEEEFADRLAQAVWSANQGYCDVEVRATYLEVDPPSEIHTLTQADYEAWRKAA